MSSIAALPDAPAECWVPTALLPLPRALALLWRDGASGTLTQRGATRRFVFCVEEGHVRFVRSDDPDLRLDRVLTQLGRMDAELADKAQAAFDERRPPVRMGQVLVENGWATEESVRAAVQVQLRSMLREAVNDRGGEWCFAPGAPAPGEDVRIDSDVRDVLVAACSAWDDDEQLLALLPDPGCHVAADLDALKELKTPPAVRQLLTAVAEPTPLGTVLGLGRLLGLRSRPVTFGLLCAGLLRPTETREWSGEPTVDESPLADVPAPAAAFLDLAARKATGRLSVTSGAWRAWVRFQDGEVIGAGSSEERARLGECLVAAKLLERAALDEALAQKGRRPDVPLGMILVERGALPAGKLVHALRAQASAIAREVISAPSWDEAMFSQGPGADPTGPPLEVSTRDLVLEALRGLDADRLRAIARTLEPTRPRMEPAALREAFTLTESEEAIAQALGTETAQVLDGLGGAAADADVLRMAVLALLVA